MYASVNNMLAVMTLSAVALWKHVLHKNICNTLYFFIGINTAIIIQNICFVDFGLKLIPFLWEMMKWC